VHSGLSKNAPDYASQGRDCLPFALWEYHFVLDVADESGKATARDGSNFAFLESLTGPDGKIELFQDGFRLV
jgi:hypothetical protein